MAGSDRRSHCWSAAAIPRRTAIEKRTESPAAAQLRELVKARLAPHLRAGTKTLHNSNVADSDSARRIGISCLPNARTPRQSGDHFVGRRGGAKTGLSVSSKGFAD